MPVIDLALIISGIIAFPFFLSVLFRNSKNPLNISYSVFMVHIIFWAFSIAFFRLAKTVSVALFWDQMIYYCGTIVPVSVFYFSYVLVNKKSLNRYWTTALVASAIFTLSLLFFRTKGWISEIILNGQGNSVILGPYYVYWMIYFATIYIAGLYIIFKKYLKSTGYDRLQLIYVFSASLMPIFIGIVPNVLLPLIGNYELIYIGPFANTVMAIIITYAILKHRFLDISFVVARSVSYFLLIVLLGLIYSGGLFIASSFITKSRADVENIIVSTVLALIIAFTFQPLRVFLEKITDKIFFKQKYNTEELLNILSKTMAISMTLADLSQKTLTIITKNLRVTRASFAIFKDKGMLIVESENLAKHLELTKSGVESLMKEHRMLVLEEIEEGQLKEFMRSHEIYVAVPLQTKESFIGFLILGEKSSGEIFFDQDINFLSILGPELSVALQNAQRFEQISEFNVTLQEKVKRATVELQTANEKLQKLDQVKDEFISIASHDLRSPMATVKNYIWLAKSELEKTPAKAKTDLDIALESTEHGISLVADMLDVSRIEAGRIELNPEKLEVKHETDLIVEELQKQASDKHIELSSSAPSDLFVKADKERIHQVITNLVGNAIKFTPEKGSVTLSASKKGKMVEFTVADTGIGIKKEDIDRLFTKFGKLETGNSQGTGLGLYISKGIVELSGGKIWVESTPAKGSKFIFTLPII